MSDDSEQTEFKEKLRSLALMGSRKDAPAKKTVDVHDYGTVEVTEHWNENVDVTMKPETIHLKGPAPFA